MKIRKQKIHGLAIGILATLLMLVLRVADPNAITTLRGAGFDTYQRLWPRKNFPPQPVRIVDIDEASLQTLGQWPWPRTKLAKLVDELSALGAAAIAFDIVFPEPDRMSPDSVLDSLDIKNALSIQNVTLPKTLPNNDAIFAAAISNRPVVTAFATTSGPTAVTPQSKAGFAQTGLPAFNAPTRMGHLTQNIQIIDQAAAGLGSMNIDLAGEQGIARQIPLVVTDGTKFYPSLSLEALRVAQGVDTYVVNASSNTEDAIESVRVGGIEIPLTERGQLTVYYSPNDPTLSVSAARVIEGNDREALSPLIAGNIVLVGTSALGLLDTRTSSLGQEIAGVSIHAQALQQILSGTYLNRPWWAEVTEYGFVAAMGLLISTGLAFMRPLPVVTSLFACLSIFVALAATAFLRLGILVDATFPVLGVATIFLIAIAFRLLITDREGRQLRNVFGRYVAPSVLTEIENNPNSFKLGGETRDVTVMFVDIQNFTPMSENLKAEDLVNTVNRLLSLCSKGILDEGGTIDKFIGDAVMAFWNAPIAQVDHQYLAARAALNIQNRINDFNADPTIKSLLSPIGLWPIAVRIGLATGPAVVGNMGSQERFDYSVLGETVNLASRAEGICKTVKHNILIAGKLEDKTKSLAILQGGAVLVRGKSVRTSIHLVFGNEAFSKTPQFMTLSEQYGVITKELSANPKPKRSSAIKSLINLSKAQNPAHAAFLDHLEARRADYQIK